MNNDNVLFDDASPEAVTATSAAIDAMRTYGVRLPEDKQAMPGSPNRGAVESYVEMLFDNLADITECTEMSEGDHLENFMWGIANLFHRSAQVYQDRVNRLVDRVGDLRDGAGAEVVDSEMHEKLAEIEKLQAIRDDFFGAGFEEATAQYHRFTGSMWRPRNGSSKSVSADRKVTASSMDLDAIMKAEADRANASNRLDPTIPVVVVAPGCQFQDEKFIYAALDRTLEQSGGQLQLVYSGYDNKPGTDRIIKTWIKNRPTVTDVTCRLHAKDGKAAGYKRNGRMLGLAKYYNGVVVSFGKMGDATSMCTDLVSKAQAQKVRVLEYKRREHSA